MDDFLERHPIVYRGKTEKLSQQTDSIIYSIYYQHLMDVAMIELWEAEKYSMYDNLINDASFFNHS